MTAILAEASSMAEVIIKSKVGTVMKDGTDHLLDIVIDKYVAEAEATNVELDSNLSQTSKK